MAVLNVTDAEFGLLLKSNEKVVVKYYADWCGSCKLFAPKYKRMSDSGDYEGVTFIEVNAETNPEARHLGGVNNLPFISVFKNGTLVEGVATSKEEAVADMVLKLN